MEHVKRELPPGDSPAIASAVLVEAWRGVEPGWQMVKAADWPPFLAPAIEKAKRKPGETIQFQGSEEEGDATLYRVTASKPLPATYPTPAPEVAEGRKRLRDLFACSVAEGIVAAIPNHETLPRPEYVATYAYKVADAMLKARDVPNA